MGKGNNNKYSRKELLNIITRLGFSPDKNNGKVMGKGDHVVYVHKVHQDLKLTIPVRKDLCENEMSDICSNIIITMRILGLDTSIFKTKEGVEGKLMKAHKNAEKNICILFSPVTKKCLGLTDEQDITNYIESAIKKIHEANHSKKK